MDRNIFLLLVIHLCSLHIYGTPILPFEHALKSSSIHDHALQKGSTLFDQASKKGVLGEQSISGFSEAGEKKYDQAETDGRFNHEDALKKFQEQAGNFAGENFHKLHGGSLAGIDKKISHKKGHQKSGFHNSYHKDESGGKSSFYDEANDEGDEQIYNSHNGLYGDTQQNAHHGTQINGELYANDARQHGGYHKGNNYGREHGDAKKYNQGQYYDDRNVHAVNNLGHQHGAHGLVQEKTLNHHTPYHQPYPAIIKEPVHIPAPIAAPVPIYPIKSEPKITVYEDPRYPLEPGFYDERINYQSYHAKPQVYEYYY